MIFQNTSSEEFFETSLKGKASLLYIKEQGCRYCEFAEAEMKRAGLPEALGKIRFHECSIDQEPGLATKLGLVGVPAFLKVDVTGRKKILVGFESIERFIEFLKSETE